MSSSGKKSSRDARSETHNAPRDSHRMRSSREKESTKKNSKRSSTRSSSSSHSLSHPSSHSSKSRDKSRVGEFLQKHKHRRIQRKKQKHVLKFEKFVEHVETRHHYYVVSVIVDSKTDTVKFIECRTPIRQKTFFVYINPKYLMKAPDEKLIRMRITYLKDEQPTQRNKEFIQSIRGRTVNCDMLIIASEMVYFVTESADAPPDIRCFSVGDLDDESEEEEEVNKYKKINDDIKKIASSLGISGSSSNGTPANTSGVSVEELEEHTSDEDVDIRDPDDEPYDPVKSAISASVGEIVTHKDPVTGKIVEKTVPPPKPRELPVDLPKKPHTPGKTSDDKGENGEKGGNGEHEIKKEGEHEIKNEEDIDIELGELSEGGETGDEKPAAADVEADLVKEGFEVMPVQTGGQAESGQPTSSVNPLPQPIPLPNPQAITQTNPQTNPQASHSEHRYSDSESEESEEEELSEDVDEDNEIPDIEEEGIVLGMAYVVADIHMFLLKIDAYEEELSEYYVYLEENEQSMRKTKVERISYLADHIQQKVVRWFEKQTEKEATIKTDIMSLSVAILKITAIKQRIEQNPTKFRSDVIQEVTRLDELYASSREMVRENTVKLLKVRDLIENVLYESTDVLERSANSFRDYISDEE